MKPLTPAEQARRWAALSERTNARHIKRLKAWRSGRDEEEMNYVEAVIDFCGRFHCEFRDPGGSACCTCFHRLSKPTHTCQYRSKGHALEERVADLMPSGFTSLFDHVINVQWENGAYGILTQPYISRYEGDQTCVDEEIAIIENLGFKVTKIHPSPYEGMALGSAKLLVAFLITGLTGPFTPPVELHDDPFVVLEHNKEHTS